VHDSHKPDAGGNTDSGPDDLTNAKAVIRSRNGLVTLEQKNSEYNQALINAGGCKADDKYKNSAALKNQPTQKKNDQVNTQIRGGIKEKRRAGQAVHDTADDYKTKGHPAAQGKKTQIQYIDDHQIKRVGKPGKIRNNDSLNDNQK